MLLWVVTWRTIEWEGGGAFIVTKQRTFFTPDDAENFVRQLRYDRLAAMPHSESIAIREASTHERSSYGGA